MHALATIALVAALAGPQDFVRTDESDLLSFSYGWPAAAEQEPVLRGRLAAEMESALRQARDSAAEDRGARQGSELPFNAHSYERRWELAGLTPRLLSLVTESSAYTGGAHGSVETAAILWDRPRGVAVQPAGLLGDLAMERIEPLYCAALDALRSEKRGEPVRPDPSDGFTTCPPLAEQVIAPADKDRNGRFETLQILLAPYVAGPWVEGSYVVEVPLEMTHLDAMEAAFRPSFEPAAHLAGERG
jgi:hypothetical protein